MDFARLFSSWESLVLVVVATAAVYLAVVTATRLAGPRSLATMSSFDFAATVAIGSTVATAANLGTPLANGIVVVAILYAVQTGAAIVRRRRPAAMVIDNRPLLVMAGGEVLADNLRLARLTEPELWSQLRQAGVTHRRQVLAVVMETTGSLSVLRGSPGDLDPELLSDVRDAARLRGVSGG